MTLYELLGVLRRRWYVMVVVIVATAALGMFFVQQGGLYVTRTIVAFESPEDGPWQTAGSADRGVIVFASAVATEINDGVSPVVYSTADAPFYGAGIRQGVRVALPDTGGQWDVAYNRAVIMIDAVSPDRAWVAEQQQLMVRAVVEAADTRQAGIPAVSRITVSVEPMSSLIEQVAPGRAPQLLAVAALGAAALLVGGWLAAAWDRRAAVGGRGPGGIRGIRRLLGGRGIS